MASSQIEIASPFDCLLRNHNQKCWEKEREGNSIFRASFHKNLKEKLREVHPCVSLPSPTNSNAASSKKSQYLIDNCECWVGGNKRNSHKFAQNRNEDVSVESSDVRRRRSRILDRWASIQARDVITTIERQNRDAELLALSKSQPVSTRQSAFLRGASPTPTESSVDIPKLQASSLVRMWKQYEAEAMLSRSPSGSLCSSVSISIENASFPEPSSDSEACDSDDERCEMLAVAEDSSADSEYDQTTPSEKYSFSQDQISEVNESKRARVAEIIRSPSSGCQIQSPVTSWSDENDREQFPSMESPQHTHSTSRREWRNLPCVRSLCIGEGKATIDLLMQMERERQRELTTLVERRAVSRFPHRDLIQSLIKLRFLHEVAAQDQNPPPSTASQLDQLENGRTIRRSVKNVLASDFQLAMDQVILSYPQIKMQEQNTEDEEMNTTPDQYHEVSYDSNYAAYPMLHLPLRSKNWFQGHEESCDSNEIESTSLQLPLPSYFQESSESSSSIYHHFLNMEIINDLRGHIKQSTEEDEEENPSEHQYHGVSYDFDQLPLPSELRSRNWFQDHDEESVDSYRVASTSLQFPLPSTSYYQETQESSPSFSHHSLEMEVINDLRGYIEQLHEEMSALRKAVESCMNIQLKLKHSIKQDNSGFSAAVSHSEGEAKELSNWAPIRKGSCCICYEMQVDTLLYRCGHMCTCFMCAQELQWNRGRCPICRVPIIDVVRAFSDS